MQPGVPIWSVLALLGMLLIPGIGCTLAFLRPKSVPLPVRLGVAVAAGYAVVSLVSLLFVAARRLWLAPVLVSVALISVSVWAFASVRWGLRAHADAIVADVRKNAWRYALLLLVLVGFGIVRATYTQPANLAATTMRYWADGVEIADTHRIPATSLQWDTLLQPVTSKAALNAFNATLSLAFGRDPFGPLSSIQFVMSLSLALLAAALAESLGLRYLMPLAPVLLFADKTFPLANATLTTDLSRYVAEDWGRIPALAAVVLLVIAVRPRGPDEDLGGAVASGTAAHARAPRIRAPIVLGAVLLGVAAGTHLVATVVAVAFVVTYALAAWVVSRRREILTDAATLVLGAAALGVCVLVLAGGNLGFNGAAGSSEYADIAQRVGLPPGTDPTAYLVKGVLDRSQTTPYGPGDVLADLAAQSINRNRQQTPDVPLWPAAIVGGLAVAAVVVLVSSRHRDLRALGLGTAGFLVSLVVVAIGFALRYDVFALATFGNRRLFNYLPLAAVLLVLGVGELALRVSEGLRGGRIGQIVAIVLTVAVSAAVMPGAVANRVDLEHRAQDLAVVRWVGSRTPCQGRIPARLAHARDVRGRRGPGRDARRHGPARAPAGAGDRAAAAARGDGVLPTSRAGTRLPAPGRHRVRRAREPRPPVRRSDADPRHVRHEAEQGAVPARGAANPRRDGLPRRRMASLDERP